MRRVLTLLILSSSLYFLSSCGEKEPIEYKIQVEGQLEEGGVLEYLDYSMSVYEDLASNSCGTCADQPVCLYVGEGETVIVNRLSEAIERADDLWMVKEMGDDFLILKEKEVGTVKEIGNLEAPEGVTLTGEIVKGKELSSGSKQKEEESTELGEDKRLAAVYGPSYEMLVVLGQEEHIVVRADVQTDSFPWAEVVFQRIGTIPQLDNVHMAVNVEELAKYEPDLSYTFPRPNELKQMEKANITAVPGKTYEKLEGVKIQLKNYANTLDEEAVKRADQYEAYFDEKLDMVIEKTKDIPDQDKPKVYYCGTDILTTYGKYSDLMDVIKSAGGIPVSQDLEAGNRTQIDSEQLMEWNPDYIFIDHGGMNGGARVEEIQEDLYGNSKYQEIEAIKNQQIHLAPSGVFYWDMGLQKILLVMYMAKTFYPEEFKDLDMVGEVQNFYTSFYDYPLTEEEAIKILNRENP
ncbi:MAG TPA: ABC transporter substrate-binding protein [Candidatus Merdenecus merdavium]|nr:ABC transporter substrate-binding protein [Candidatus Merdenecus merdavium]